MIIVIILELFIFATEILNIAFLMSKIWKMCMNQGDHVNQHKGILCKYNIMHFYNICGLQA